MPSEVALLEEIDSYKDTVHFLIALIHELTWLDDSHMRDDSVTHEHGLPQARDGGAPPVTPDLALLRTGGDGQVGEAKISFPSRAEDRSDVARQLMAYDSVVSRWIGTGRVARGGSLLLTHMTRKMDAVDYLGSATAAFSPKHPFAVIAAMRNDQRQAFVYLERAWGELLPATKDAKLRGGVSIRLDHLTRLYGNIRFYDAQPPLTYLMEMIWDLVLPSLTSEAAFRPVARRGRVSIGASLNGVAERLRNGFSMRLLNPSLREAPSTARVELALDRLVAFGLGRKLPAGQFTFEYRRLRGGTLKFLLRKSSTETVRRRRAARQLPLFGRSSRIERDDDDS
jgi:hypothetical protein